MKDIDIKRLTELQTEMDGALGAKNMADSHVREFVTKLVADRGIRLVPDEIATRHIDEADSDEKKEAAYADFVAGQNFDLDFSVDGRLRHGCLAGLAADPDTGIVHAEVYSGYVSREIPLADIVSFDAVLEFLRYGHHDTV